MPPAFAKFKVLTVSRICLLILRNVEINLLLQLLLTQFKYTQHYTHNNLLFMVIIPLAIWVQSLPVVTLSSIHTLDALFPSGFVYVTCESFLINMICDM